MEKFGALLSTLIPAHAGPVRISAESGITSLERLLSVVVPAYNVESYLGECLNSLLAQTYKRLDIIVIVDGATDRTADIAKQYAEKDGRIRVYYQKNAGLSVARNAGASLARGEFLWFVDSDDTVKPQGAKKMIRSLRDTGSDFAVGSYQRFNSKKSWKARSWIRDAHTTYRPRAVLRDDPGILVNAVACSKIFRLGFWRNKNLSFPIGALYEDQPVTSRAYACATAFDVLPIIVYNWRARDDNSSISQQSNQLHDLGARIAAAQSSLRELQQWGSEEMARERAIQLLANDMPISMRHLADADASFWHSLSEGIASIAEIVPPDRWKDVPAQYAALEWLLMHKEFDRAAEFVKQGGTNVNTMIARPIGADLVLESRCWEGAEVSVPQAVAALSPRQIQPAISLRRAFWMQPGILLIEGWAYLPIVSPDAIDNPASFKLISAEKMPHEVPVSLASRFDADIDRISKHQINDDRRFGFRCELDIDKLELHPKTSYRMNFCLAAGAFQRTTNLTTVQGWGSAGNVQPSTSPRGISATLRHKSGKPVELRLRRSHVYLIKVTAARDMAKVQIRSDRKIQSIQFRVWKKRQSTTGDDQTVVPAHESGDGKYVAVLGVDKIPAAPAETWIIRAIDTESKSFPINWPDVNEAPIEVNASEFPRELAFFKTKSGNLGLRRFPPTVHLESVEQAENGLSLVGRIIGNRRPSNAFIAGKSRFANCRFTVNDKGRLEVLVPWRSDSGGMSTFLGTGRHEIVFKNNNKKMKVSLSDSASEKLPLWLDERAPVVGRLERHPRTRQLWLIVLPTLSVDERGARRKRQLIDDHQLGAHVVDPEVVLFRTLSADGGTDALLKIYVELRNRNTNRRLYWTVKDSSVSVPDGAIPLFENSRRWFKLLSTAKYIYDGPNQPEFFRKRPGQIVVVTAGE